MNNLKKTANSKQIEDSRQDFIKTNTFWIGQYRDQLSEKAYLSNLKILKQSADYFNEWEKMPLLAKKEWIPEAPIRLEKVSSSLVSKVDPPIQLSNNELPFNSLGKVFNSFSEAIKETIKPKLFEDNTQYRITDIRAKGDGIEVKISKKPYSYFWKINYGKSAEYEYISAIRATNKLLTSDRPSDAKELPLSDTLDLRKKILLRVNDSKDLSGHIVLSGISTLTLIKNKNGDFRFLMHARSSKQGSASNTRHVVPAGEFQPLKKGANFHQDIHILHNIMKEYAEELGGFDEFSGVENESFDYANTLPFKNYLAELNKGNFNIYYLGFGLDPLNLQGEILTCAVFTEESFSLLFGDTVRLKNEEGVIISDSNIWGIPFDKKNIEGQFDQNILPAATAILGLTKKHLAFIDRDFNS